MPQSAPKVDKYPNRIVITHAVTGAVPGTDSPGGYVKINSAYTSQDRKVFRVVGQRIYIRPYNPGSSLALPDGVGLVIFGLSQYPEPTEEVNTVVNGYRLNDPMIPVIDEVLDMGIDGASAPLPRARFPLTTPSEILGEAVPRYALPFGLFSFYAINEIFSRNEPAISFYLDHEILYFEEELSAEAWIEMLQMQYAVGA